MKYNFVVNPTAGKGKYFEELTEKIKKVCDEKKADYEVYVTTAVGDATEYVKRKIKEGANAAQSFFACGGDGTLCEVVNGIMKSSERENVFVGTVPSGTGNDFVRNFTNSENFFDIDAQLSSDAIDIDLIGCNDMYAVNMINIGFDCEVVCKKEEIQKKKIVPSKFAYIAGLVLTLIRKPGVKAKITYDGGTAEDAELLLTTFANGEYCGGGFHSNPESAVNNGKINALAVNSISRLKFISIVGSYKKGTHLKFTDILKDRMCDKIILEFDAPTNISVDGEIITVERLELSAVKKAVKFLLPRGTEYLKASREETAAYAM